MFHSLWYKHAVIYNLDIDTFMDSDGDGIGDFEGLMRQMDYLHSLGIDVIWLSPFQPSPKRDNGYDIADYYNVDPRHGTLGDFAEFLHMADNYGIKVLMDLVVNHTSDQHPWFQKSRQDENSEYRDWYIWSKEKPEKLDLEPVFPGIVEGTWTYDETAKAYYHHRFFPFQPDLNVDNPHVRTEIHRIIGFWLRLGVNGFRKDAVPFFIESLDLENGEQHQKFDYLYDLRDFLQWRRGDAILLGEVNVPPDEEGAYFGEEDEVLHMIFNFNVNQHLFYALATGEVDTLREALEATRLPEGQAQWAHFLRNHDELNLDQLSKEQQERVFAEFAPDEDMRIFDRGIRRRLAPMLGDRQRLELAYSMLFSLPGTPVLYYGEEIGMGDDLTLEGRSAVRTPMQWANEPQAGFSSADALILPVIAEGEYGYPTCNVEDQRRDADSFLNWMAHIIRLRHQCPEIGWGKWTILETGSASVIAMRYDWQHTSLVTIHNFSAQEEKIEIQLDGPGSDILLNLLAIDHSMAKDGRHSLILPPYGYRWYRGGGFTHLLTRQRL